MSKHDCEVTLDPKVYAFLEGRASDLGVTLDHLFVLAITEFAQREGFRSAPKMPTGEIAPLIYEALGDKPMTIKALTDHLGRAKPSVVSAMNRLKTAGFVRSGRGDPNHQGKGQTPRLWERIREA